MADPLEEIIVKQRVARAASLVAGPKKLFVSNVSAAGATWTIHFIGAPKNYQVSIEASVDDNEDAIGRRIEKVLEREMARP
ncbi:MAG TPA: hypothetical protein VIB39_19135 [Candidatus Angelobacter sp.]|jgi:hypothetical protein